MRVLGGVCAVARDGSLVDLPSASQRRLLAVLALHAPRRLRAEWIADAFDISPGALRTLVSRVRGKVGAASLETGSTGYAVLADVDATQFCRAVTEAAGARERVTALLDALAFWNGPALEEFAGEEWADGEIARLTEIHAGTVDDLADALIEARRPAEAIALLEGQLARSPYRDRPRGLLIRALASAGRQADALRAFQQYRNLLADEFGTDPSAEVVRIERRVATGWDGTDPAFSAAKEEPARVDAANADFSMPIPTELTASGQFIGRADELHALEGELARAGESRLRVAVVTGEAGIGKTALLAAFARSVVASASATVVYGRCDETGVSLQPFRTVLAACVEHAPDRVLAEHVAQCGGELRRVCPSLSVRVATAPVPTESDDSTQRFLAFEAAADLLRRMAAARPLVVMLDDVQWAEPTALLLLRHLARALAGAQILIVLGSREPATTDDLRLALAGLDQSRTHRLDLVGLAGAELDDLLSASGRITGAPELAQLGAALHAQTAGNPLYATQVIRHWAERGFDRDAVPMSLRDVVWSRVNALGEDATEVLGAASVLGEEFSETVLVEMVDLPEGVVIAALDAAARGGLLLEGDGPRRSLRFVHALVENALYADIGPSRRAHLHGRAARALEKNVDDLPGSVAVQLARHCQRAGWHADALQWSVRAGDDALAHVAPSEAAQHYRTALDIAIALDRPAAERADLLVRLGDAQHRCGDARAFETLVEGARLAHRSGATAALVRAAFAADRGFVRLDSSAPEHLAILEAALAAVDPDDIATFARLRALLARELTFTPDTARRLAAAHEALDLVNELGDETVLAEIAPSVLYALWAPGREELRARVAVRAVAAARSTGDPRLEFGAALAAYNVAVESADRVGAATSLATMRAVVQELAEPRLRWTAGVIETFEATMEGRLAEAEALATANLDLGLQIAAPDAFTFFAAQLFSIGTFGGRHDELSPLVEQAMEENPGVSAFKLGHAIICAATGREEVAREVLWEGVSTRFQELGVDSVWMTSVIGYAVLATELDDAEAARHLLPLVEPHAAEVTFNGVTSQGPVSAYAGKLAALLGRHDAAEQYLRAALDTATEFGWKYHRATTLYALAQTRHRQLRRLDSESEEWLAEASALCAEGGFRIWERRVAALAGAR